MRPQPVSVRRLLLAALAGGASLRAAAQPAAMEAGGAGARAWRPVDAPADAGVPHWLGVDDPPQRFDAYFPAGGPLQRPADRPGAWYLIVFVALPAHWPVKLLAWQRAPSHELRIAALDGWPGPVAQVVAGVPVRAMMDGRGRPILMSAAFALAPDSQAGGAFLLVEQWSAAGKRPSPLWLQARAGDHDRAESPRGAWWQGDAHAIPASPLQPRHTQGGAVIVLPIRRLAAPPPRPAPQFEPWWDR